MENKYLKQKHKINELWIKANRLIASAEKFQEQMDGFEKSLQNITKRINQLKGL